MYNLQERIGWYKTVKINSDHKWIPFSEQLKACPGCPYIKSTFQNESGSIVPTFSKGKEVIAG